MRATASFFLSLLILSSCVIAAADTADAQRLRRARTSPRAVLWRNPGDIKSRNLLYGPGSPEQAPVRTIHIH